MKYNALALFFTGNTRRHVRSVHSSDENQKALFTPNFLKQAVVMSLWFFTSFASIVLNKYILSTLDVDASLLGMIIIKTVFIQLYYIEEE